MSDDDVLSVVAYLRSLQPIRNPVPAHQPSFLAKALFTFGIMKPQPEVTAPVTAPPAGITVERGKYLVAHASTCMDCHSPIDLNTGEFYKDSLLMGGNIPFGKKGPGQPVDAPAFAYGPNLTPDPETGIGTWTEEQYLLAVRTGTRPDGTVLTNHMPYSFIGLWPEDELKATYLYLKSLKPVRNKVPPVELRKEITEARGVARGDALFKTYCQSCHGEAGAGAPPTKLVLADLAQTIDNAALKKFIRDGQINLRMPSFGKTLSEDQLDDVVAYIRTLKKK
jgi:mono/diheme cytochrome c family protein